MKNKRNLSSIFASKKAGVVFLILLLVCGYFGLFSLCVFFFFFMCLALVTSFWGKASLKNVKVEIDAFNSSDFPGKKIPVTFRIHNRKWLPIAWLHMNLQEKMDSPIQAEGGYSKNFSWIFGHETLEWMTSFQTVRRGVYTLDQIEIESGDGFGLGTVYTEIIFENESVFYVYPKLMPVHSDLFLRQIFEADAGSSGYYEDPTLIKSIRDYQSIDSFKKINWRLYAKQQKLQTNIYEMIQPKASFFMIDLQSYRKMDDETTKIEEAVTVYKEELEEMLRILASLFMDLEEKGMKCGLLLPEQTPYVLNLKRFTDSEKKTAREMKIGKCQNGKILIPDAVYTGKVELLSALAEIDYHGEDAYFDQSALLGRKGSLGKIYLVTRDVAHMGCSYLMHVLEDMNTTFICNQESENSYGLPMITVDRLRREGS